MPDTRMASLCEQISFDDFYKLYPRKVGKGAAEKAWQRVQDSVKPVLMSRLQRFIDVDWKGIESKFVPHPATWLNARRWEDEVRDVPELPVRGHDAAQYGQLGVSPVQPYRTGVIDYPAPTEEERALGIKVLKECRQKLVAHDMRLRLKVLALRRTGKWSHSD